MIPAGDFFDAAIGPSYAPPQDCAVDIIYQDEFMLVVNKPAGLLSVPGRGMDKTDSLLGRAQQIFPDALCVHRLDMSTSGLLLLARGKQMQQHLSRMFRERSVKKHYVAIVAGRLAPSEGEINLPLGADWPNRPRQKIDITHGKASLTHYRVLENNEPVQAAQGEQGGATTRVGLRPITGRTHQLRLHMAAIGHPILGDALYGAAANNRAERLMLHARMLSFSHPLSGKALTLLCEAPF
ncbi:MAG TPA: RluA family pseudouridine synthase [Gallionella sp.]|nr:RluA family pseudouridine synthase [Gallionella sp.]